MKAEGAESTESGVAGAAGVLTHPVARHARTMIGFVALTSPECRGQRASSACLDM